ncbi:hypothetical protein EON65_54595 [archaeon]|nr:MAG: hypothetical protein EON65_54595 [archaeon]
MSAASSSPLLDAGYTHSAATRFASSFTPHQSFHLSEHYAQQVAVLSLVTVIVLLAALLVYWISTIISMLSRKGGIRCVSFLLGPRLSQITTEDTERVDVLSPSSTEDSSRGTDEDTCEDTPVGESVSPCEGISNSSDNQSVKPLSSVFGELSAWSASTLALEVTLLLSLALLLVCAGASYVGYLHLTTAVHTAHRGMLDTSSIIMSLNEDARLLVEYGDQVSDLVSLASHTCPYIDTSSPSGGGISEGIKDYQDSVRDIWEGTRSMGRYANEPLTYFPYYYQYAYGVIITLVVLLVVPPVCLYGVHRYYKYMQYNTLTHTHATTHHTHNHAHMSSSHTPPHTPNPTLSHTKTKSPRMLLTALTIVLSLVYVCA